MSYQEKQCIGFECFYFGFNSLYSAVAASEKVEVYKISIDKLVKILTVKNKKALNDFAKQSEKTIKILLNRIIKINCSLINKYSLQNNEIVHKINFLFDKAINKIQSQNQKIKGSNTIYLKIKTHKKIEPININYYKDNNNDYLTSKIKSNSTENINHNLDESCKKISNKKSIFFNKLNKFDYINDNDSESNVNLFNKYDLTAQIKIFDQKANLIQQKYRELERESCELERLTNAENRKISHLKRQNIYCQNFFKLSQGDKRIFIKNKNSFINTNNFQYHYSLKGKSVLYSSNNNKEKMTLYKNKGRNKYIEEYPFNSRYDSYKPYKYDKSKTMLVNKKMFEFSIFNKIKNTSCDYNDKKVLHKYNSNGEIDIHKYNLKKKNMIVINCQNFYNH